MKKESELNDDLVFSVLSFSSLHNQFVIVTDNNKRYEEDHLFKTKKQLSFFNVDLADETKNIAHLFRIRFY